MKTQQARKDAETIRPYVGEFLDRDGRILASGNGQLYTTVRRGDLRDIRLGSASSLSVIPDHVSTLRISSGVLYRVKSVELCDGGDKKHHHFSYTASA